MRSIVSSGYGRRPRPALGYAGSIRSSNADHGVTCSISARNFSRLVRLRLPAYSASPKVICVIDGSRVGCCATLPRSTCSEHPLPRAAAFYDALLAELGGKRVMEFERGIRADGRRLGKECVCTV